MTISVWADDEAAALPDWVRERPVEADVLYGMGQAPVGLGAAASHFARNLAFGDIASQINVHVSQDTELMSSAHSVVESGVDEHGAEIDREFDSQEEAFLTTMRTRTVIPFLPGAEVAAQEQVEDQVYVLVRMPRERFRSATLERIAVIDRVLAQAAAADPSTLTGVRILRQGYARAIERQTLAALAPGVDLVIPEPAIDPATIIARCGLLIEPQVYRIAGAERFPQLAESVRAAADMLGITIAEGNAPARFQFTVHARERVREQGQWHRAAVTATITVTHLPSGQSLGQIRQRSDQASTQGKDESLARAYDAMDQPIIDELEQRLFALIAGADVAE
ncbi:MAG: hypothetical protein EA401_03590 [Planctomycetota bacterium]|nr:MAG: hypothetical protein EA401_03590 [Planctomycetota bacterium]